MKFNSVFAVLALAAPIATASKADQKPVLVSYPHDTPLSVIEEAKEAVIKAGGVITHEFNLIKGFAANAAADVLDSIQAMEAHSGIMIEEDKVVRVNDS